MTIISPLSLYSPAFRVFNHSVNYVARGLKARAALHQSASVDETLLLQPFASKSLPSVRTSSLTHKDVRVRCHTGRFTPVDVGEGQACSGWDTVSSFKWRKWRINSRAADLNHSSYSFELNIKKNPTHLMASNTKKTDFKVLY